MEEINHPPNIYTVLDCLIPFINDRKTFSLVCRKSYDADCTTRKHVTVLTRYATSLSRLCQRFPFLQSLTLDGARYLDYNVINFVTPWVQQITTCLYLLNSIYFKDLSLKDSDLELLAQTRGKQLQIIEIFSCKGFSTLGLFHVGKYCNSLRDLCVVNNEIDESGEKWLRKLGSGNSGIEKLTIHGVKYDMEDLVFVAKNCGRHLVSVNVEEKYDFVDLVGFFGYAVNVVEFGGGVFSDDHQDEYNSFKFPDSLKRLSVKITSNHDVKLVVPFAHLLAELDCRNSYLDGAEVCELIKRSRNLKVLHTTNAIGDQGLRDISIYCKNLCKLFVNPNSVKGGEVSHDALIHIAEQCVELECLHVHVDSMTDEVMRYIGKNMRKLKDFSMFVSTKSLLLDDGVRSLLICCDKLEKLDIHFGCDGGLTDKGLGFIGKYGCNLRYLSLGNVGVSSAGLVELSKGCPKIEYFLVTKLSRFKGLDIFSSNVCIPQPCGKVIVMSKKFGMSQLVDFSEINDHLLCWKNSG
ncbi:coronatine-insensitive protein 1-like [Rutidosis leptorrhynchoides]|uniref:coronatine-insensitive protein 1-like n=1 Tax=Rutidosis leptorrhynchoides TaxID=125765 RepID=UPI003A9A203A